MMFRGNGSPTCRLLSPFPSRARRGLFAASWRVQPASAYLTRSSSSSPSSSSSSSSPSSTAATSSSSILPARRIASFGPNVWLDVNAWIAEANAKGLEVTNLGQGFPSFQVEAAVKNAVATAVVDKDLNQYTRSMGHPRLVNALAKFYSGVLDRAVCPMTELLTTNGASEGLYVSTTAFVNPGDEVIIFEPFYDSYAPNVLMAGGTPVFVPYRLRGDTGSSGDFYIDMGELRAAVTPETKMMIINNPNNPTGKVLDEKELVELSQVAIEHDLLVLSDEVYEHLVHDGLSHTRIAALPGMWDRTITLGSAGKTFGATGWKIGWAYGAQPLIQSLAYTHQYINFTQCTGIQEAIAFGFEEEESLSLFAAQRSLYQRQRDRFAKILKDVGIQSYTPQGSYFTLANTKHWKLPQTALAAHPQRDYAVAKWLTSEFGVCVVPPSAFYSEGHAHLAADMIRFCFCKSDEILDQAADKLQKLKPFL